MRRVKIQDVADALKISRVTVWKALNDKEGVSEDMKRKVLDWVSQMEYSYSNPSRNENLITRPNFVSVVVSRPETSAFWVKIIHQLSEEFSSQGIGLLYTYLPDNAPEDYVLPPSLTDGTLQGIIVINVYNKDMICMLNNLSIPKVFLDTVTNLPFHTLNGDLILLEGKSCINEIASYMIRKGCKSIGFIGDIQYAKTNMERYEGYLTAMNLHKIPIEPELCFIGSMTLGTYTDIIDRFVEELPFMPDGFVCVNDHAATILLQSLERRGYGIPEDVLVSGYDDNNEFTYTKNLTTVHVDNSMLAKRLAKQLLYRIENTEDPYEVTYIRPNVVYRSSTSS